MADIDELQREVAELRAHLAAFTGRAHHDLMAPLRRIRSFATLLEEDLGGLEGEAAVDLHHLLEGVDQLESVVSGLVALGRVASVPLERRPTALAQVVADARDAVGEPLDSATLQVGALPTLAVDARWLVQAVEALLDNTARFRHPDRPLRVDVSWDASRSGLVVADNGSGLPDARARALEPFTRLDPRGGAGHGLALCHRIAQRHGGGVVLEDNPGGGTRVALILPVGPDGSVNERNP